MDKLSLHETLRIYLPGLLFSFLFCFMFFPSFEHLEIILFTAIFISLILDTFLKSMYQNCFRRIESFENFRENLRKIIVTKLDTNKLSVLVETIRNQKVYTSKELHNLENSKRLIWTDFWNEIRNLYSAKNEEKAESPTVLGFLTSAYFAKKFSNQEIYRFRYPNSLGQMYYNFSFVIWLFSFSYLVKLILCLINENNGLCMEKSGLAIFTMITILLSSIILSVHFMRTAKSRFRLSIKSEISYWSSINRDEVEEIASIIGLWEDLYKNSPELKK